MGLVNVYPGRDRNCAQKGIPFTNCRIFHVQVSPLASAGIVLRHFSELVRSGAAH
jgi:hypothetical protein